VKSRLQLFLWFVLVGTLGWSICMLLEAGRFSSVSGQRRASCSYFSGQPILDLELASSPKCFQEIIEQGNVEDNAQVVRIDTYMDFLFIALYGTMFVVFAFAYRSRWSKWVIFFISMAAIFDCLENFRILQGAGEFLRTSAVHGASPRLFSMMKWTALAVALLFLGRLCWDLGDRWSRALSLALLASGVLTLPGLYVPSIMKAAAVCFAAGLFIALVRCFPFRSTTRACR
jgi:hypothetical protein